MKFYLRGHLKVADQDFQIREGVGANTQTLDYGGTLENNYAPYGPLFGLKIRWRPGPPWPLP